MDGDRLKHLEFIQNVVSRMNTNSFFLKGWTVTLVSALFALSAKDSNQHYVLVTFVAITAFWLLDGFYLSQERQYRALYDNIARTTGATSFSMDAGSYRTGKNSWLASTFSRTLLVLYVPMFGISLLVVFALRNRDCVAHAAAR